MVIKTVLFHLAKETDQYKVQLVRDNAMRIYTISTVRMILFILIILSFCIGADTVTEATAYCCDYKQNIFAESNVSSRHIPHFLLVNKSRYDAFQNENPNLPYDVVVALVNANVDFKCYENIQEVKDPYCYLALVNKNFSLPKDFTPSDLVQVNGAGTLREKASESYINMREAAKNENLTLVLRSSFRNYHSQVQSFNIMVERYGYTSALSQSAKPGHSEHQLGLSIDVFHKRYEGGPSSHMHFQDTKEFEWMIHNAHRFGFILRYPKGMKHIHGFVFEPWHWRYIGVDAATVMFDEGILTFEEYYGRYLDPRIFSF